MSTSNYIECKSDIETDREFLAEESPNSHEFFGWIDLFSSVGLWNPRLSQEEALKVVSSNLFCESKGTCELGRKNRVSSSLQSLLELALSTRHYAPRLQAYYQFYASSIEESFLLKETFDASCGVWADYQGHQYCTLNDLKDALKSVKSDGKKV